MPEALACAVCFYWGDYDLPFDAPLRLTLICALRTGRLRGVNVSGGPATISPILAYWPPASRKGAMVASATRRRAIFQSRQDCTLHSKRDISPFDTLDAPPLRLRAAPASVRPRDFAFSRDASTLAQDYRL